MIIYKIDVSEELKQEIRRVVHEQLHDLADGDSFAFLHEGRAIVGRREGNKVIVDQMVNKAI